MEATVGLDVLQRPCVKTGRAAMIPVIIDSKPLHLGYSSNSVVITTTPLVSVVVLDSLVCKKVSVFSKRKVLMLKEVEQLSPSRIARIEHHLLHKVYQRFYREFFSHKGKKPLCKTVVDFFTIVENTAVFDFDKT